MKKLVFLLGTACIFAACSKKDKDNNPVPAPLKEVMIADLPAGEKPPGDPTAGKPDTLFFSFSTAGKVSGTDAWDIGFTGIYNSTVISNTVRNTWMSMQQRTYSSIQTPPAADYNLSASGSSSAGNSGWYSYNGTTHVLTALEGRTLLVKQQGKTIYKLEMISIYKGNPKNPTMQTPAPFLHFRYTKFE